MKRPAAAVLLAILLLLAACVPTAAFGPRSGASEPLTTSRGESKRVEGEVLVRFRGGAGAGAVERTLAGVGAVRARRLTSTGIELLEVSGDTGSAIKALQSSGLVYYAEPNFVRHADFTPNDPNFGQQWNFNDPVNNADINMPAAWDTEKGSASIVVAVLDTGIAYRNGGGFSQAPDLAATSFTPGYDFINNDAFADDDHGHGTHVAGTVAQSTNNALGVAGVAYKCTLMPVKVLDNTGIGTDSEIIEGLDFASANGVDIINMSLSGPEPNSALEDALNLARGRGVVLCASSGNEDDPQVGYPAAYSACIAVGATNRGRNRSSYSNYGSALDVCAPGGEGSAYLQGIIQQTFITTGQPASGFKLQSMHGTSMACPHVAGVAALVLSKHPTWTVEEVEATISSTCSDIGAIGWDNETGWGLIDAAAAVTAPRPSLAAPHVSSVSPDHATTGSTVHLAVTGAGFASPLKVALERDGEKGIIASGVTVVNPTHIECDVDLAGAQGGPWNLVVQNDRLRGNSLDGGLVVDPANDRTWYLAEGSTSYGFEEYVLIQNPGSAQANASLTFMTSEGAQEPLAVAVPAQGRVTVRVNDYIPDADVSTRVTADQDIICERSMYWGDRVEGTDCIGVQSPSYSWYLAEGTTDYGFDTYVLVQNPSNREATVYVTYMTPDGPVEKEPFVVDANSRATVVVADDLPAAEMSFKVFATQRVIAERSMYWDGMRGGHDSIGTVTPSRVWYLAEGTTDWGYDEYVLLQNPGTADATVTLTCMTPEGPVPLAPISVPAGTRKTVHVNEALPKKDVSVKVEADNGVIAERSMYWNNGSGKAGHCAIGVTQARQKCYLAEGTTDWGFEEWILIQNPNSGPANIGVQYMTPNGAVDRNGFVLEGNSRVTVNANADLVPPSDASAYVYSNMPIIAERSMYWNGRGGGHVSTGLMK